MDQKILDALKTINDKLGGTNDPNENWGSLLQEIAQNVGSGGGVESLVLEEATGRLNKTFGEILDAISAGRMCVVHGVESYGIDSFDSFYPVGFVMVKYSEGHGYTGTLEADHFYSTPENMASLEAIRAEYPRTMD